MNTEHDMGSNEDTEWMRREQAFVDRVTRIVRMLAWIAMLAAAVLMVWILAALVAAPALAQDPQAVARDLGLAGQAAASAIAKDAAKTTIVPGYAGTAVPERGHTAAGMEDAARRTLADPDDPGGQAGRAVIEGTVLRPETPVSPSEPAVQRSKAVLADPQASAHGAGGLASGSVSDCNADLGDAGDGGACGSVTYCVGAGCETVRPEANTGFARSTAMLNMVLEMGGDEFDREDLRFFKGARRACSIRWFGWQNCCTDKGFLLNSGLAECNENERLLAEQHAAGTTRYLGEYCAKKTFFGVCIRRARAWCVFGSKLGRILHGQGRSQLGIGWGSCRGFTVAEIERIDFDRLDLSEFTENLVDGSMEPSVSLPDAGETGAAMSGRIREFYTRGD